MTRFNLNAIISGAGLKNAVVVSFGVECDHLIMFHDVRKLDDDCKAKLGIKSGRKRRYATDCGVCMDSEPSQDFIRENIARFGLKIDKFVDGSKPTPKTPKPTETQPDEQPEIKVETKVFVAPKSTPKPTTTEGSGALGALGALFGGIKDEIKTEVLQILEPYVNAVQRVEHKITLPDGKKTELDEVLHEKFDDILKLVCAGYNVYLYGEAGTGKSEIAAQVAKAMQLPYHQQDKVEHIHEFIGYVDAHGNFHDTPLYRAWTQGGICPLDEFDGYVPEAVLKLNGALSQGVMVFGDGKQYKKHPDCHIIATGNTNGTGATEEYSTRYVQDASSLNRFVPIQIDYCKEIEQQVARKDVELLDFVRQLRNIKKTKNISMVISYRDIKHLYELEQLFDVERAIEYCVVNRLDEDTARIMLRALPDYDGKWFKAAKKIANKL